MRQRRDRELTWQTWRKFMIDPWRFDKCGCGSEWCWAVSRKLFVFIAGMFRRRSFGFSLRWLSCSIKDIMAFQGWICLWSQSHPPLPVCFVSIEASRCIGSLAWMMLFHVLISQIQPHLNEGANMDHVYSIHLANDAVSLTFFVWAH